MCSRSTDFQSGLPTCKKNNNNNNNNSNNNNKIWDTDHLISAKWADLVIVHKHRKKRIGNFVVSFDHRVTLKENEMRDKYLDLARERKKTTEREGDSDTNCNLRARYSPKNTGTGIGGLWNKRTTGDHQKHWNIEISQNTEKSPGNLRKLAVTQTPMENHQQTLVWRTL